MDPTDPGRPPAIEPPAPWKPPPWPWPPPAAPWPSDPAAEPPPARGGRGLAVALTALGLLLALIAAAVALRPSPPAPRVAPGHAGNRTATQTRSEVGALLARRAKAIVSGDRAAFLATVDRRRTSYYRAQTALFARMRTVPFSAFAYRVSDPDELATERVRRRYAPDPVYLAEVQARYRFRGQDASPMLSEVHYTFVRTGAGWRIAGQGDAAPARDDVEIWDAGPVRTRRTARTLVVLHPGSEVLAARVERAAETAYWQVAASWPRRWEQKAVILVPRDEAEAERMVGARDLRRVAALARSSIESGPVERVLGSRIVVNSANAARSNDLNLQIVLTHEMTHLATRALGTGPPLLLVEGFAEYTALRPYAYPFAVTRPGLAANVRAGRFAGTLPTEASLRGRNAPAAYDEASSFCLWVAETFGEARLRALYQAFAGPRKPSGATLDRRFRRVLGVSKAAAQARWADWVRRRL
jgi:hypothetical protein